MVRLKKSDSDTCAICDCPSNGILRFGISACRACAAFFRRSIVENRTYECRFEGDCSIGKDVRCICRACRLEKCRKMGMDLSKGQKYCGHVWPQESGNHENSLTDSNEQTLPTDILPTECSLKTSESEQSQLKPLPNERFIHIEENDGKERGFGSKGSSNAGHSSDSFTDPKKQLALNSSQLEPCSSTALVNWSSANATTTCQLEQSTPDKSAFVPVISSSWRADFQPSDKYDSSTSSLFMNPEAILSRMCFQKMGELIEGTCTDNRIALSKDFLLISKMVNDHFHPLDNFSVDSKWSLIYNFHGSFALADTTYRSIKYFPGKDDTRFMVSGRHYADHRQLLKFYNAKESTTDPNLMAEIFGPVYLKAYTMMGKPSRNMNITEEEIVGLMGLCFWNESVNGLSDREIQILKETEKTLHDELYLVCQRAAGGDLTQGGIRFATLCNMVTYAHKFFREVTACYSLVNALNLEFQTELRHNPHAF
ncbi:zinc finger, c4 type (two domains) domain-containing protein [Ditylenchus destructor]|nr:zinc finger, c4 type (two domains) domain-containing protein [Ditylenchus destructor]